MYNLPENKLNVVSARLRIGSFDRKVVVEPGQKMVQFETTLEPGDVNLQTWFTDSAGNDRGAYFVYVEQIR